MKKKLSLALTLVMVLMLFASCTGSNNGNTETASDNPGNDEAIKYPEFYKIVEAEDSDLVYNGPEMELVVNLSSSANNVPYFINGLERVKQRTGGKVTFVIHYNYSLLGTFETLNGLSSGVCDISDIPLPNYPSQFVYTNQICALPFMGFKDIPQGNDIIRDVVFNNEFMMNEFKNNNIIPLMTNCIYGSVLAFKEPTEISSPETLKGIKILTSNRIFTDFISSYGGSGVDQPVPEIYSALSTGVVDAVLHGTAVLDAFGALDITSTIYTFENDLSSSIKTTCINLDTWNSFDDTLKKIFEEEILSEKFYNSQVETMVTMDENNQKRFKEKGIDVRNIEGKDLDAWIKGIEPYTETYIKELNAQGYTEVNKAFDIWQKAIAKHESNKD